MSKIKNYVVLPSKLLLYYELSNFQMLNQDADHSFRAQNTTKDN
jgi:hypothetical protein